MPHYTMENIPDNLCIGHQVGEHKNLTWFENWFIEQSVFIAKVCKWIVNWVDGPVTVRKQMNDGRVMIWVLTGDRNCRGEWLGVWPD